MRPDYTRAIAWTVAIALCIALWVAFLTEVFQFGAWMADRIG